MLNRIRNQTEACAYLTLDNSIYSEGERCSVLEDGGKLWMCFQGGSDVQQCRPYVPLFLQYYEIFIYKICHIVLLQLVQTHQS